MLLQQVCRIKLRYISSNLSAFSNTILLWALVGNSNKELDFLEKTIILRKQKFILLSNFKINIIAISFRWQVAYIGIIYRQRITAAVLLLGK